MGKSTTAKLFSEAGCAVFDSDKAVHKLYEEGGAAVEPISNRFPEAVKDNKVDRKWLSDHIGKNPQKLALLERIIHPLIAGMQVEFITRAQEEGQDILVFDVPLLFEGGGAASMDKIVVVSAPYNIQKSRALARVNMDEQKLSALIARQMPDAEKRKKADFVIYTHKGVDFVREQVQSILWALQEENNESGKGNCL